MTKIGRGDGDGGGGVMERCPLLALIDGDSCTNPNKSKLYRRHMGSNAQVLACHC